jgi:hypothetical protein
MTSGSGNRANLGHPVVLNHIAGFLGGWYDETAAFGTRRDVPVRFEYAIRRGFTESEAWTEIDVAVPGNCPLAIHVRRRRWFDKAGVTLGEAVGPPSGDATFDQTFFVEAAPRDIGRVVIDARIREVFWRIPRAKLDTVELARGGSQVLRLAIPGWLGHAPTAIAAIELIVASGARVLNAYAVAGDMAPTPAGDSPYRSPYRLPIDSYLPREALAAPTEEVVALERRRARRGLRHKVKVVATTGLVGGIVAGIVVLMSL